MLRIILACLLLATPALGLEVSIAAIDPDEQTMLERACVEYDRAARVDGQTTLEECIVSLVGMAAPDLLRTRVRRLRQTSLREEERAEQQLWLNHFEPQADLARCGDGEPDAGEECDPGMGNFNDNVPNTGCRSGCRNPYCGDGVKDSGEVCDDGPLPRCKADCSGLEAMQQ
jgi:hypothetical protein